MINEFSNSKSYVQNFSFRQYFFLFFVLFAAFPPAIHAATGSLLRNGGFEGGSGSDGQGGGVPDWSPYGRGYVVDRQVHRGGDQSIRCESLNPQVQHGARTDLTLNQRRPVPVMVTGWSKADAVQGSDHTDYSLYVDVLYTDGTPLYGLSAPFRAGTHDWQRRQVLVLPTKPIRAISVYALFRKHTGTAWFDDFEARPVAGASHYDSQAQSAPRLRAGPMMRHITAADGLELDLDNSGMFSALRLNGRAVGGNWGGFYLRDVASDGPLVPMRGTVSPRRAGGLNIGVASGALRTDLNVALYRDGDALAVDGELQELSGADRAVTVYLALPVGAIGWQWGQDVRHSQLIETGREYTNQVRITAGATGGLSLYPFGAVGSADGGVGIASQQDWPSIYRIFYNSTTHQFVIAWDFALTGKTAAWAAHTARFRCKLFRISPGPTAETFRRATERFYRLYPRAWQRRAMQEGIWMPFTNPTTLHHPEDFGFAYHEGDNSVKSDDRLNILSFRYTEPSSYWLPMPPEMPRTYENAVALIQRNANDKSNGGKQEEKDQPKPWQWARAVLNSGTQDEQGRYNLDFRNEPWANGAVFALNPNPDLSASAEQPTRGSLAYTVEEGARRYGAEADRTSGHLDGEYLDSLETWTDVLDYRLSNLRACPYPLPFDTVTHEPVLPQWYSVHAFTRALSDDLHNRDRLLFANSTPIRFSIFSPLLDVMGIEVNWIDEKGNWQPDDDATLNMRRTLSGQKPYLLLMNTDFDKFTHQRVEKYMQRCLLYGIYPSMFSYNAANNPYWETPKWYERDRDLFKKYIPVFKRVSAAGWQPITHAHADRDDVWMERWGDRHFTVFNSDSKPHDVTLTIDLRAIGQTALTKAANLLSPLPAKELPSRRNGSNLAATLHLNGEQGTAIELR